MKYKVTKETSPSTILAVGDGGQCFRNEFEEFLIVWYSLTASFFDHLTPFGNDKIIEEVGKHPQWPSWLITHGFVELIEQRHFSDGERILIDGHFYILRCHSLTTYPDCYAGLFSEDFSGDWTGIMVEVSDREKITSQDINKMIPGRTWKPAESQTTIK